MEYAKIINPFFDNLPVLVTGGAGFIGSHLVKALVDLNARVSILDDLSTGNLDNLDSVINRITFIKGDITNSDTCQAAATIQAIIFHCAARISVPESLDKPSEYTRTNVMGTCNILEAAHRCGARVIFSSSAAIYGGKNGACREDAVCTPTSIYGLSKLIGEQYCRLYHALYHVPSICPRYFNVYADRPGGSMYEIMHNALRTNQPITIFGDGTQTRDFVSRETVVQANLALAQLPDKYLNGQAVNIASGESISLNELLATMRAQFPSYTGKITYQAERPGDIKHSQADITKLRSLLTISAQQNGVCTTPARRAESLR